MPMSVLQVIMDDGWAGGALIQMESEIKRASSEDCVTNYTWLKPFARSFPSSIPSGFFCADVFLYADRLMMGRLLKPSIPEESKTVLAGKEGSKMKRLMSGLRYLWRSSSSATIGKVFVFIFVF